MTDPQCTFKIKQPDYSQKSFTSKNAFLRQNVPKILGKFRKCVLKFPFPCKTSFPIIPID